MTTVFELPAMLRDKQGKGASRRLRREQELIPGIVYGAGQEPRPISLPMNKVKQALQYEAFYSHILTLDIAGKKEKVVLKDLQRHPSKPFVTHMDFQRVVRDEPITMHVPLHFVGADQAPGVTAGGVVSHTVNELAIKCLPQDLPEFIEVDIGQLGLDEVIHLKDIDLPQGVEVLHNDPADALASIHVPKAEPVEEPEDTDTVAPDEVPLVDEDNKPQEDE